ncbi:MAG: glycosyltransferase family 2 protein [Solirubrobacteraceae bacterium]
MTLVTDRRVDISVCVVAWNAAEHLAKCLDALPAAAGARTLEAIVVDNGSSDPTAQVLGRRPGTVIVRNNHNDGITPARNQALRQVSGGVVVMLDADTVPLPGSLETMADYLQGHPEVGLIGPRLLDPDGTLQLSCRRHPTLQLPWLRRPPLARIFEHRRAVNEHLMRDFDHAVPRPVDWVIGACQAYRAELPATIGGYDERIFSHGGEDTDWCLRTWAAGLEVHYLPSAEVVHAYGHFTRRRPLSKQALRGLADYYYMLFKHRRGGRRTLRRPP